MRILPFKLLALAATIFLLAGITANLSKANAQESNAAILSQEIEDFFQAGASGYLVWQYGGDQNGRQIAVDQFSWYRDTNIDICLALREKAEQYPDRFVGVNINNIGAAEFADGTAAEHLSWLKNTCGVSVVRAFAKIEGAAGVQNALNAAQQAGVKMIIAIGDYSNGGGGIPQGAGIEWYESGYQGEYQALVSQVRALGSHPALWGYELANEPHCGGNAAAMPAYKTWGQVIGSQLRGVTSNVGYGQMASQDTTRCDSTGPGDFKNTNSIGAITVTSAHYYTESEKQSAMLALSQSQELGKPFYIGEAPPGGSALSAGGSGVFGYDLSKYPEYLVDPAYYLLHPIRGIHPLSRPDQQSVSTTRGDLAAQGYEAHCAAEPTNIKLNIETEGLINRFLELYEGIRLETESNYTIDSSSGRVPIFRDTEGRRFLTSSLEEYFGFEDYYASSYPEQEVNTAPINSLMAAEQRCIQSVRILTNTQKMCERLGAWDRCAPRAEAIPNTDYIVDTLLDDISDFMPDYYSGGETAGCQRLFGNTSPQYDKLKKGILNTPLYINRSYRLAFMVASIEQRSVADAFSFFSFSQSAQPKHEVLIVAFKIPDILTNKGGGEESGHFFFTDAVSQTRNILVPQKFKLSEDEENPGFDKQSRDRRTIIGQQATGASTQGSGSTIYCLAGDGNTPAELAGLNGAAACKDVLGKSVVDLINGNTPSCDNLGSEPVREIFEAANIIPPSTDDSSRVYREGYGFGTDVFNYIFLGNQNPQRATTVNNPLKTIFDVVRGKWSNAAGQTAKVDFFLVYPVGYELESVTEVMKHTFFNQQQVAKLEERDTKNRFDGSGFQANFGGGSASHTYQEDPTSGNCEENRYLKYYEIIGGEPVPLDPPIEVVEYDCSKNFRIGTTEEGRGGISFLGASLGYWLRNVQRGLNTYYGQAHAYLSSCSTTEEFLLGKCAGGITNEVVGSISGSGAGAGDGSCNIIPTGPCSVETLLPFFEQAGFSNPQAEAEIASRICNKESRGGSDAVNKRCLTSQSVDYSIGLFQINLMAHCPGALADASGRVSGTPGYNAWNLPCQVADQALLNSCETAMLDPLKNIEKMIEIRTRWGNWNAWSAASYCGLVP